MSSSASDYCFDLVLIPHEEDGIAEYVDKYKAFRLHSLQVSPESFSSTYARESAFAESVWHDRLANPQAHTFVASKMLDSDQIVSILTLVGPLPYSPDDLPPVANPWLLIDGVRPPDAVPRHYRLNAVFTLPEMRRRGISEALIQLSIRFAREEALDGAEDVFVISVVVERDNLAAKALYEKCGFEVSRAIEPSTDADASPIDRRGVFMLVLKEKI